jgi:hypothetical protein
LPVETDIGRVRNEQYGNIGGDMKGTRLVYVATAVLVAVTLACGGASEETPTPEPPTPTPVQEEQPTPEQEPTARPVDTPEPEPEGTSLEITNESGVDVWYIQLSPTKAETWGDDWLGENIIADGDTYVIEGIPEGTYDVRALDEFEEAIEVWWDEEFIGTVTWTIVGVASLEIVNESPDTIVFLYISPTEDTSWGDDWLGEDVIGPGESYTVPGISLDTYDIQAADADDNSIENVYSVELRGERSWDVTGKALLPDNAVLRFEDEFEDNRNAWGLIAEDEDVKYSPPADGEFCILIKTTGLYAWEWYEPFRTDEFVVEVFCHPEGVTDGSCGLGFGPDADNFFWFEVYPLGQQFGLLLWEDGLSQDNLIDYTQSVNIDPSGPNTLSMQRVRGVVSVYVNGVVIGEAETDLFPTGRVGIGGNTFEESYADICMDNLRVWRLE